MNIDHVATLRQARRGREPDPIAAANEAESGGADGVTIHLREDRRHIQDIDAWELRRLLRVPLNLEMAATEAMIEFAIALRPDSAMLVPEGRQENTTEGGLDIVRDQRRITSAIARLDSAGIPASVFIDPREDQVRAAAVVGARICEIHTGTYAKVHLEEGGLGPGSVAELSAIGRMGALAIELGMRFNAGHGLTEENVAPVAALPGLYELHIGHSIVSQSVLHGIREAVARMKRLVET